MLLVALEAEDTAEQTVLRAYSWCTANHYFGSRASKHSSSKASYCSNAAMKLHLSVKPLWVLACFDSDAVLLWHCVFLQWQHSGVEHRAHVHCWRPQPQDLKQQVSPAAAATAAAAAAAAAAGGGGASWHAAHRARMLQCCSAADKKQLLKCEERGSVTVLSVTHSGR